MGLLVREKQQRKHALAQHQAIPEPMGARPERHYRRPESPEEDDPGPALGSPTAASTAAAAANGRGSGPAAPPATSQQQDAGLPSRRSLDGENTQQKADLSQRWATHRVGFCVTKRLAKL